MGILVLGSALLEGFALLQILNGGNDVFWRVAAMALPFLAYFLLLKSKEQVPVVEAAAHEAPNDLERKLAALASCPSVANKIIAADELMRRGRHADAVPLYQSALTGIYANEPDFMFKLAQAHIEANDPAGASACVARLTRDHARYRPEETRLLHARILEGQGNIHAALSEYDGLASAYVGLEARCRFGLLLMREGDIDRAHQVFNLMVRDAETSAYAMRV
ncbi:MAG: tetratricopeptide repeat protein [Betaproteobacteria bacterium]|nr:tetratricopeptide repeat protein [Betaproteobacteria bacterium]